MADNIDKLVCKFLSWQLPRNFTPDGGITFVPISENKAHWPSGTNLLNYEQAREMIIHMLSECDD